MDRDTFLSRVGQASLTSVLPGSPPVAAELSEYQPDDLVAMFRARAQAVNAVVHGPISRHGAPRVVVGIVTGHNATKFMAWDDLPASGVASAMTSEGMERVDHQVPRDGHGRHTLGYLDLDVGITGAYAGLAESGSVVLAHGPGRPRMASLIPEVHVVLIEVSSITTTLAHWAAKNPHIAAETTNLVVITGPSRTGDIEQQLNLGVHGPRHVHIVMIR